MKTVLITGCSSGFGRGMVDEFLRRGWFVIATMRNAEERQGLLAEPIHHYGDRLSIVSLDVTSADQRDVVVEVVRQHGRLDCLVNNAGDRVFGALEDLSETQLCYQMKVNFFGAAFLTRSLLPDLRASQGAVIFVSSTFGYMGFPLTSAYCASKFAVEGLAESLHYELKPHGVHVSLIEPGASKTNFGQGAKWANGSAAPYRSQTKSYHRLKERLSLRATNNTPYVARTAANLAERKKHQLRVRVGQDAAIAHLFIRLVPRDWQIRILNRVYRRVFLQESR
ncbi:MAG TPA: SDR family oxidoreductase [Elainellaceae cyanobacterium]